MTTQVKIYIPAHIIYLFIDFTFLLTTGDNNMAECVMFQQKETKINWNVDHVGLKVVEGLRDP